MGKKKKGDREEGQMQNGIIPPWIAYVSGIVGISMQNRKSIKINIKIKRQKEGVNSVVLLGKEEEEKKKERKK